MKPFSWINAAWVLAIILGLTGASCTTQVTPDNRLPTADRRPIPAKEPEAVTQARVQAAYGKLPLHFEPNQGQTDPQVKFLSRGNGYTLFLTPTEAVLALHQTEPKAKASPELSRRGKGQKAKGKREEQEKTKIDLAQLETQNSQLETVLRMQLVGANPNPQVEGLEKLPGKANYFIGNDPKKWHTNIPTYARVRYRDVYPGVDLVYYGNQRQLEHDFIVAPGADPKAIQLAFEGIVGAGPRAYPQEGDHRGSPLRIDSQGDLILQTADGEVRLHKPRIYQEIDGLKQPVPGGYALLSPQSSSLITFHVAAYDTSKPLIIDPVLDYSTFLGGSSSDSGSDIAVDGSGNAYITGGTQSADFPVTTGAYDTSYTLNGRDAFVTKLNANGSALVYSTYLGGLGSLNDSGSGIAVDSDGNAYVAGYTAGEGFPTTTGAYDTFYNGGTFDAFVTKLNADGSALVYSTYLGGNDTDLGLDIAVDSGGGAYVTGYTYSMDFPKEHPVQYPFEPSWPCKGDTLCGPRDAFVTRLNPKGSALYLSTYLGGSNIDDGFGIAIYGDTHVTGQTCSTDFPTKNPLPPDPANGINVGAFCDAFVAIIKLSTPTSSLTYSTYLGGNAWDLARSIAVDSFGSTHVTGETVSPNFPTTKDVFQGQHGGGQYDAFVTKLDPSKLIYSTYLGGSGDDYGNGVAVDPSGAAYVTGNTTSSSGFLTVDPLPGGATFSGGTLSGDAFVTKFKYSGSGLLYSTYLGGSSDDGGGDIAVDSLGSAYVTGATESASFPWTVGAYDTSHNGGSDAFVAKITAPQFFTLQVIKVGSGSGTVTSNPPGISCGAACGESYSSGTVVTLTATADPGSTFLFWGGDSDCTDGQVTMTADKFCTATFKKRGRR